MQFKKFLGSNSSDGEFLKNVITLFSGTASASALPILFSPIIARLYTPEQFGVYAIITAILNVFSNVAGGRYEMAVMLPKKAQDSKNIIALTSFVAAVFSILLLIGILIFNEQLKAYFDVPLLKDWLFIVPFFLWLMAMYKPLNYWLAKFKAFNYSATAKFVQGLGIALATILLGWIGYEAGLILGYFLGWIGFVLALFFLAQRAGMKNHKVTVKRAKELASEYREFPVLNVVPTFLNDLAVQLAIFIITAVYSAEETGFYNFSRQYAFVPMSLIATTVGTVYFQRISDKINDNVTLSKEFFKVFKVLAILAIAVVFVMSFGAPFLFDLVFGSEWKFAGEITTILIFAFAIKFLVTPFGNLLPALKEMRLASIFPIVSFVLMGSLYLMRDLSFTDFLIRLTIFESVAYGLYFGIILFAINKYERNLG